MEILEKYDVTGDSEAAMQLLVSDDSNEKTPQDKYNRLLLTALAATTKRRSDSGSIVETSDNYDVSSLDESLEEARRLVLSSYSSSIQISRKRRRVVDDWMLAYNRGLVLLANGRTEESIREVWSYLKNVVMASDEPSASLLESQPPLELSCRMGFLIIEAMLTIYPSRMHGKTGVSTIEHNFEDGSSFDLNLIDVVLSWLTVNVEKTGPPDPQLKFLLSLYNSRVAFFELSTNDSSSRDKHMRSARKELKQAMEIFQQKLRPSSSQSASTGGFIGVGGNNNTTDASSVMSASSYSEEVAAATSAFNNAKSDSNSVTKQENNPTVRSASASSTPIPQPTSGGVFNNTNRNLSRILQGQNQAALNLKANAEQLKGNVKKSFILCGEAQVLNNSSVGAANPDNTEYYDAIHQNNLAIIYETNGKSHLALHSLSKAIRSANRHCVSSNGARFESDGTVCPDVTLPILSNAAFCALKSRNYAAAYECYAVGLASSNAWKKRPRTWLRLSEACIGIYHRVKSEQNEVTAKCSKVEIDGKARGLIINDTFKYKDHKSTQLPPLGSKKDLKEIKNHVLTRARVSLGKALALFEKNGVNGCDVNLQSARLSLAYISLEEKNFKNALNYSVLVMDKGDAILKTTDHKAELEPAYLTMVKRQIATARMYASEAYAILGNPMESMKLLVGDGKDDAFDRLASDLAGVTLEIASNNTRAKSRLAKSQTMVRCSASAASAALGSFTASKQLAMSAQAMEKSYGRFREGSSQARKALIYCMLREENHSAALALLKYDH